MSRNFNSDEWFDAMIPANQELNREQLTGKKIDISSAVVPYLKAHEKRAEKELQSLCENYLTQRGYWRLTAENVMRAHESALGGCKGFWGHLSRAKRNPIMPDLFIFSLLWRKRALMIELKCCNAYEPSQKEMIAMGMWTEVRDFESFKYCLDKWEG